MNHPGFKAVASSIAAKQGISKAAAAAVVAKSTRNASAAAKRKNPRLKNVPKKKG
jgi:acetyl-CoA acetyltransferase